MQNWYKTAKKYTDIGHQEGIEYILWHWDGGLKKSPVYNSSNVRADHSSEFGKVYNLAGRYDITNGILSIAIIDNETMYEKLVGRIMRAFPAANEIWVFGKWGSLEGERIANASILV